MKKPYKRLVALALASMMTFSLAACGNQDDKKEPEESKQATDSAQASAEDGQSGEVVPGWQKNVDDKVKLTWYLNFSWFTTPWGKT